MKTGDAKNNLNESTDPMVILLALLTEKEAEKKQKQIHRGGASQTTTSDNTNKGSKSNQLKQKLLIELEVLYNVEQSRTLVNLYVIRSIPKVITI